MCKDGEMSVSGMCLCGFAKNCPHMRFLSVTRVYFNTRFSYKNPPGTYFGFFLPPICELHLLVASWPITCLHLDHEHSPDVMMAPLTAWYSSIKSTLISFSSLIWPHVSSTEVSWRSRLNWIKACWLLTG